MSMPSIPLSLDANFYEVRIRNTRTVDELLAELRALRTANVDGETMHALNDVWRLLEAPREESKIDVEAVKQVAISAVRAWKQFSPQSFRKMFMQTFGLHAIPKGTKIIVFQFLRGIVSLWVVSLVCKEFKGIITTKHNRCFDPRLKISIQSSPNEESGANHFSARSYFDAPWTIRMCTKLVESRPVPAPPAPFSILRGVCNSVSVVYDDLAVGLSDGWFSCLDKAGRIDLRWDQMDIIPLCSSVKEVGLYHVPCNEDILRVDIPVPVATIEFDAPKQNTWSFDWLFNLFGKFPALKCLRLSLSEMYGTTWTPLIPLIRFKSEKLVLPPLEVLELGSNAGPPNLFGLSDVSNAATTLRRVAVSVDPYEAGMWSNAGKSLQVHQFGLSQDRSLRW